MTGLLDYERIARILSSRLLSAYAVLNMAASIQYHTYTLII